MRILHLAVATTALLLGRGMAVIPPFNETTGLPLCAYDCKALWAAQYACAALPVGDQIKCFCDRELKWDGTTAWNGCDSVCEVEGRGKVAGWLGKTCGTGAQDGGGGGGGGGSGTGRDGNGTSPGGGGGETGGLGNSTVVYGGTGNDVDETKKARAWFVSPSASGFYVRLANVQYQVEEKLPILCPRLPSSYGPDNSLRLCSPHTQMGEAPNNPSSAKETEQHGGIRRQLPFPRVP